MAEGVFQRRVGGTFSNGTGHPEGWSGAKLWGDLHSRSFFNPLEPLYIPSNRRDTDGQSPGNCPGSYSGSFVASYEGTCPGGGCLSSRPTANKVTLPRARLPRGRGGGAPSAVTTLATAKAGSHCCLVAEQGEGLIPRVTQDGHRKEIGTTKPLRLLSRTCVRLKLTWILKVSYTLGWERRWAVLPTRAQRGRSD